MAWGWTHREQLREEHALGQEIAQAITSAPIGEPIDTDELEDELTNMEQEALDDKMLKTGNIPVTDTLHRLPAAANGERTSIFPVHLSFPLRYLRSPTFFMLLTLMYAIHHIMPSPVSSSYFLSALSISLTVLRILFIAFHPYFLSVHHLLIPSGSHSSLLVFPLLPPFNPPTPTSPILHPCDLLFSS